MLTRATFAGASATRRCGRGQHERVATCARIPELAGWGCPASLRGPSIGAGDFPTAELYTVDPNAYYTRQAHAKTFGTPDQEPWSSPTTRPERRAIEIDYS